MSSRPKVVLVGDPIVDVVAHVGYDLIERLGFEAGGCQLASESELQSLLELPDIQATAKRTLGGSAANAARSLAVLGCELDVRFCGLVGEDDARELVTRGFGEYGVTPVLPTSSKSTAMCLCLVTPDGQRTMRTCLAAAGDLQTADQVPAELLAGSALLHCEGYTLYRAELTEELCRRAKASNAVVSLDLASMEIVRSRWTLIRRLLKQGLVDVMLCNDQEAAAVCEMARCDGNAPGNETISTSGGSACCDEVIVKRAAEIVCQGSKLAVISRGPDGCLVRARDGVVSSVPTDEANVEDTVGAGDAFTAGVLWALLEGGSAREAGVVGCALGALAVQTAGGQISRRALEQLRGDLRSRIVMGESEPAWDRLVSES